MPFLRIPLGLILGIDIRVNDTSGRTGMIWCGLPGAIQQFDIPQFF
jgi:hypothetical protein